MRGGGLALAHNGNLVNFDELRATARSERLDFSIIVRQRTGDPSDRRLACADLPTRVIEALRQVKGAYSLVVLTEHALIAVRDPHGFRPLVIGRLNDAMIVASETCALDLVRAEYIREVEPGEMVVIKDEGMRSIYPFRACAETPLRL